MKPNVRLAIIKILVIFVLIVTTVGALPAAPVRADTTTITESFSGSADGWKLLGNASLTKEGNGWLRLTTADPSSAGAAFYNTDFPSMDEFDIEFDYATWGGGDNGADGLTFFMIDGSVTPTAPGGTGGFLGYGGGPTHRIDGGYFAVGFDEYSAGDHQANIGIYEPFNSSAFPSYSIPAGNILAPRDAPNHAHINFYRNHISVWLNGVAVIHDHSWSAALPGTVKFGFSAATGYYTDYHEIRNATITVSSVGILRVTPSGSSNWPCGQSWDGACAMQTALNHAEAGNEIWAAAGTYTPTTGTDRNATFQLKSGVALYGGFAGTETMRKQRNFLNLHTILSGEINDPNNVDDNSYFVVTGSGTDASAILDGFTVTAGNANGIDEDHKHGGGVRIIHGTPTLSNLILLQNHSGWCGGGMSIMYSNPVLTNIVFMQNSAALCGGGLHLYQSNPTITNAIFTANTSQYQGGGFFNDGGSPILTNASFLSNTAVYGGGMENINDSHPILTNVTLYANSADSSDGGIGISSDGSFTLINSILWGNIAPKESQISDAALVTYSDIQGDSVYAGVGNINADPDFVAAVSGDLHLGETSPAIDAGNNDAVPAGINTDLDGNPRFVDFPGVLTTGHGSPPFVDMGAYEAQLPHIYVDQDAPGPAHDGTSWNNAFTEMQAALAAVTVNHEIWVAEGTYYPDPNGLTDSRAATFQLKNGVALYGGFAGTETSHAWRDPAAHPTLLSGDLSKNGTLNVGAAYHVVTGSGTDHTARLDGFTITAGNADGNIYSGGGMYNNGGSPTLTNISFLHNSASFGGGMYNSTQSSPILNNVTFSDNSAYDGGGMYNDASSPILNNVTFSDNSVYDGGGMYNDASSPTVRNTLFIGNWANNRGGGMLNINGSTPQLSSVTFMGNQASDHGGGLLNDQSNPTVTNVTFTANNAHWGAAISNMNFGSPVIDHVTVAGNIATGSGGGVDSTSNGHLHISNSIFWANTPDIQIYNDTPGGATATVSDSLIQGGCPADATCSGNIIDADPLLDELADNGGFTRTMALLPGSPAIDSGNTNCPTTDQRGKQRVGACELGAYESQGFTLVISGGNNQKASCSLAFASPLEVTVGSASGEPVNGGLVTFTAPVSGASAILSGSPAVISGGKANVTITANGTAGNYNATASARGATSVSFSLENKLINYIFVPVTKK
jgi:hypothetical protein